MEKTNDLLCNHYKGRLNSYQQRGNTFNNKKIVSYEHSHLNEYQTVLYNRVLYGLTVFTKEELDSMHWEKKKRIHKVHVKTKQILNIWKQELNNILFDKLFRHTFKGEFAKELVDLYAGETDPEIEVRTPFKLLGISKKDIINKLIQESILPKDFYNLIPVWHGLPRLLKVN